MNHCIPALAALAFAGLTHAAAPASKAPPVPNNWVDFQYSKHPADVALVTEIVRMDLSRACVAWGREVRSAKFTRRMAALREFLIAEQHINGIDLGALPGKTPSVGQTTCGVFAMLGQPDKYNQTQTRYGTSVQMVYQDRQIYVYTEDKSGSGNGRVRSVQF